MRIHLRISSAALFLSFVALYGAATTPAAAQTSGVLIGIRLSGINESDTTHRYETLWIVNSRQSPFRATLPDLIVPRATGFWRAGVAATCVRPEADARIDQLWLVPAAQRPTLGGACPTVTASDIPGYGIALDSANHAALDTVTVVCQIERVEIHFVNGDYVGTFDTSSQTEECEPRGGRYGYGPTIRRWESDSGLTLQQVMGHEVDSAFASAARRAVRSAPAEECELFTKGPERQASSAQMIEEWYVERWRGRWRPSVFRHIYGSDCSFDGPATLSLPRSFTGHDALRPAWSVVVRALPKAGDAVSSPAGDLVIAFTSDSLFAFESNGTKLGACVLAMPFERQRVVMVQWAIGRHVARWSEALARLK